MDFHYTVQRRQKEADTNCHGYFSLVRNENHSYLQDMLMAYRLYKCWHVLQICFLSFSMALLTYIQLANIYNAKSFSEELNPHSLILQRLFLFESSLYPNKSFSFLTVTSFFFKVVLNFSSKPFVHFKYP